MRGFLAAPVAVALATLPLCTAAQDVSIGGAEFMNSCAQCHGPGGKGDGVIAGFLTKSAPDLTALQSSNGGVFPVSRVYAIIDGSEAAGAHGSSQMPAWGMRYNAKAPRALGWEYSTADQEAYVRGRILALIEHIATLQEE
ncbi:hypothetical protein DEA8626_04124 [Defluviimonas aquaemixtae]|uniref:Cytochrome c domain-containing protein n=1 Tax=Albidovulum aquaemixtae TaxID=1542388 RepID=A0A2R8BNR4_9RHOB|nr:c-type cytochrome [Defluviimonas aquaemixtae]SPH25088.1 hypothetical protein DEA8626_04124 [Defluviimonas aquaemixtae]